MTIGKGLLMRRAFMGSSVFLFSIGANASNVNLRTAALAAGWNGNAPVKCTILSGVVLTASLTANAGLTVNGSFPAGVELIINAGATIGGKGGAGGPPSYSGNSQGDPGIAGGTALLVSVPVTITNNGTIAGGGGGGGCGGNISGTGGGAYPGGAGGTGASVGAAATSGGNSSSEGTGAYSGSGGTGGALGTAGGGGSAGNGWNGSNGFINVNGGAGGAAGKSVQGNSNITWTATGTRTGPIA